MTTLAMAAAALWANGCQMPGCDRKARSGRATLCEMHYQRQWRTGAPEGAVPQATVQHSAGYVLERVIGHPLATPGNPNLVYQHRKVFFDARGSGPFHCHVCGDQVGWDTMHVDHLDDNPSNNDLRNLAPACPDCNTGRGRHKMVATRRATGRMLTAFGRTMCLTEWARVAGVTPQSVHFRLSKGWSVERAVSQGRGVHGPQAGAISNRFKEDATGVRRGGGR